MSFWRRLLTKTIRSTGEKSATKEPETSLFVHCVLPLQIAKGLTSEQLKELLNATARCTWNAISNKLGNAVSHPGVSGTTDPSGPALVFQMRVPTDQEARATHDVQSLWGGLMDILQREGADSFLREYRGGRYG